MKKNRFENGGLYDLLPSVVRHRDALAGGTLKTQLAAFGVEADKLESRIADSYAGFFIETCSSEELAHIADLVGYQPIFFGRPSQDEDGNSRNLVLRRDVAKTIWARRRKGTAEVLGVIVRLIAGWHTVVFENSRAVVSNPSIRYATEPRAQGTPDIRKLVGRDKVDQGPGLVARIATVRRADAERGRGRWHPLDVVVEAWSQRASLKVAPLREIAGKPYLTATGTTAGGALHAPASPSAAEATSTLLSARAIRRSDFAGPGGSDNKKALYGQSKAVCLYQLASEERSPMPIADDLVAFGPLPRKASRNRWIIDPEHGRVLPPDGNSDAVFLKYYSADPDTKDENLETVMNARLAEHVPIEARTGIVHRS
jgi:hypothetical protein